MLIAVLVVLLLRRPRRTAPTPSVLPEDAVVAELAPEKIGYRHEMESVQRHELDVPTHELPGKETVFAELPDKRH